ncbi:MAG: hypothetical protein WCY19_04550 [Candidatus Gastranaerophilaceae bacterium]
MKKFLLIVFLILFGANTSFAKETDYRQVYMDLQVPAFSYVHGIDPGQYYDNKNATYSIYPLFKLASPIYFKTVMIVPGYYDLTPTTHKGDPYVLFKQQGVVRYIIPAYDKELVPEGFYETHVRQPKLTIMQKMNKNFYTFLGKHFKSTQRKPAVQTYLEVNDLDNKFVSIIVYYGPYRYYTIFRTVQL